MEIFELFALFNENRPRYQTKQGKFMFSLETTGKANGSFITLGQNIGFLSNFKLKIVN